MWALQSGLSLRLMSTGVGHDFVLRLPLPAGLRPFGNSLMMLTATFLQSQCSLQLI